MKSLKKEIIPEYPYIRYPRALIENPDFSQISIEARTLLAMILDRYGLSKMNSEKYSDGNGGIYVIYTVEEICAKLRCGKTKAVRLFRELENGGLIKRIRTNGCKPSRIHITPLFLNGLKQDFAKAENKTLQSPEMKLCKVSESAVSNNEKSNNEYSNNNSSVCYCVTEDEIREKIEYDCIASDENKNIVDAIVNVIFSVLNGKSATVRIGKDNIPREKAVSVFSALDSEHICYVLSGLEKSTEKIRNIKSYLTVLLFNASEQMQNEVSVLYSYYHKS